MEQPENIIPPSKFNRAGFNLIYRGRGESEYKHYPNSFVTAHYVDGELAWRKNNDRVDTVKSLYSWQYVFEYVRVK